MFNSLIWGFFRLLKRPSLLVPSIVFSIVSAGLLFLTFPIIFGFLLGWFGSLFSISPAFQAVMMIAVSVFMIGTALNLLQVHPFFRYFAITPPRFLLRVIRSQTKSESNFAPLFLGALTVFIPCGTTQAMMALAVASGSPILGALTMLVFTLGTSPVFFTLGYLTTKLSGGFNGAMTKVVAVVLLILAVVNIDSGVALLGSPITLASVGKEIYCTAIAFCDNNVLGENTVTDNPTIYLNSSGYSPSNITVKSGEEISLSLVNKNGQGCIQAFTIPKLGIQKIIRTGTTETVSFKAPSEPGNLAFMCSMGMYRGTIRVI
ncbi:sulfite exporter TauE/SafE family protein [Candidatus Gottesmanbacteria bacterium]|nr:sulfite exporter TauE/SafE family protein [Candidatus Gottesmanbacteria bacterium]